MVREGWGGGFWGWGFVILCVFLTKIYPNPLYLEHIGDDTPQSDMASFHPTPLGQNDSHLSVCHSTNIRRRRTHNFEESAQKGMSNFERGRPECLGVCLGR
jgi:hypothetical protein